MKIYPPPEGLDEADLRSGRWSIYADVRCIDCRKEYSLPNCLQTAEKGLTCKKCGGRCE